MLPQFKGFAVGDSLGTKTGVCGGAPGPWWDVLFLYGHGQISTLLWDELIVQCTVTHSSTEGHAARRRVRRRPRPRASRGGGLLRVRPLRRLHLRRGPAARRPPHSTQPRRPASTAQAGLRARLAAFLPAEAAAAFRWRHERLRVWRRRGRRQWAAGLSECPSESPCGGLPWRNAWACCLARGIACRVSHRAREALGVSRCTRSRRAPLLPAPRRPRAAATHPGRQQPIPPRPRTRSTSPPCARRCVLRLQLLMATTAGRVYRSTAPDLPTTSTWPTALRCACSCRR